MLQQKQFLKFTIGKKNSNGETMKVCCSCENPPPHFSRAVPVVSDGMAKLIKHGVIAPLTKNSVYPDPVGFTSLTALLHLSSRGISAAQGVEDLLATGGLNRMTEIVLSRPDDNSREAEIAWKKRVNLAMALLANMTRTEQGAVELVGFTVPDEAIPTEGRGETEAAVDKLPTKPTLELVMARFLNLNYTEDSINYDETEGEHLDNSWQDPFQHFAGVLMNSTQTEAGRRFILRIRGNTSSTNGASSSSFLQILLSHLRSKNPIRRRGIAGTVRNCCLETDSSWWMLNVVQISKHLCYPLAGPEELEVDEKRGLDPDLWLEGPDKKREPDQLTRLFLVESILMLCASGRKSREKLRLDRVYVILKMADMVEESEDVSERIHECVQYLRRDEAGTEEGSSDKLVEEAIRPKLLLLPSTTQQVTNGENYDDVD